MATTAKSTVDPLRFFQAVNAPGGDLNIAINTVRNRTVDHLARNAPRNSPLNETHRGKDKPYASSFVSDLYGNQNGSGFRVGNTAPHAGVVEKGRSGTTKYQRFGWKKYGGDIRAYDRTRPRPGTDYMAKRVERVARQYAAGG